MTLQGNIALVTGASRGIGKAIAVELAQQGAAVVGTATSKQGADSITGYLKELAGASEVLGVELDVANQESIQNCLSVVESTMGSLPTILVNNAGVTADNLFLRMKTQEWDQVIATNLSGVFSFDESLY